MPLTRSLRQLLRRLSRAPLFVAVSILTLGLGVGANVAIFTVVNGVLLQPLPFPEADRLVGLWHTAPGLGFDEVNQCPALHFTYRDEGRAFEDVGVWNAQSATITGLEEPERVEALAVTEGTLELLRVPPALGRAFTAEEDSPAGARTVIVGHGYWQRQLGGDPDVLGRKLTIDGEPHDVIGVMPEGFRFLDFVPAIIVPLRFDRAEIDGVSNFSYRGVARLAPDADLESANADVGRMIPLAFERYPNDLQPSMMAEARFAPTVRPFMRDAVGDVGDVLWVLMGTVGMVLLIAAANVANLFLVRAEARHRELAVRSALGAGRGRILREFLSESAALSLAGAALGALLAHAAVRMLVAMEPEGLPRLAEIRTDAQVLFFTFGISVLVALVLAALPALHYMRTDLGEALKEGGRSASGGRQRVRGALVVGQVALALVLLAGSGLMLRSFVALSRVEPGFRDPDQVLIFRTSIARALVPDEEHVAPMEQQILRNLEALPGVASVGLTSSVTMDGWDSNDPVEVEGFPVPEGQLPPIRRFKWVGPGYFSTMGNPVIAGRTITWDDVLQRRPVVVISAALARVYWKDPSEALGRRVRTFKNDWREVVGVVGDVRDDGLARDPTPVAFWPLSQADWWEEPIHTARNVAYVVRSDRVGTPGLLDEVRRAVWAVNADLPISGVRTLRDLFDRSMARTSFAMAMLGIAAAMALALGAVGVYGVLSYTVSQRTREIGVRMALGARGRDVTHLVLRQGLLLTAIGVGFGLVASIALTRVMSSLLYGVTALDPSVLGGVVLALGGVGVLATVLPARRASEVEPLEALRCE